MHCIGSAAGLTLAAALVVASGVAQGDVVIDMPPPPPVPAVATVASDGTDATTTAKATKKAPATALARFGDRTQAQDSAGNPRGVNISSTFYNGNNWSGGGMGWSGSRYWGDDFGWGNDWGWSGYWGISPWLLMSGWGGGCCTPYGWGGGCGPYVGGYALGWTGSSLSIGSGASLRIGNVGLIR